MYGQSKRFETSAGVFYADTRADAARMARNVGEKEPSFIRGPKFTTSLRSEPKGKWRNPEVFYAGTRAAVRVLNGKVV